MDVINYFWYRKNKTKKKSNVLSYNVTKRRVLTPLTSLIVLAVIIFFYFIIVRITRIFWTFFPIFLLKNSMITYRPFHFCVGRLVEMGTGNLVFSSLHFTEEKKKYTDYGNFFIFIFYRRQKKKTFYFIYFVSGAFFFFFPVTTVFLPSALLP